MTERFRSISLEEGASGWEAVFEVCVEIVDDFFFISHASAPPMRRSVSSIRSA